MKHKSILIMCALIILSASPVAFGNEALSGAQLVNNNCARCHNSRPVQEFSMSEWRVIMPHMREKAHLTNTEVQSVLAFFDTVSSPNKPVLASATSKVDASPQDILTRYGCQGCHLVQGAGGTLGPSLDNVISEKGKAFFIKKVKNPQFNNSASAMPQMPISDEELEVLVDFLSN